MDLPMFLAMLLLDSQRVRSIFLMIPRSTMISPKIGVGSSLRWAYNGAIWAWETALFTRSLLCLAA